jgi:enoyl-CoA hydratase/carnithine racemase
MLTITIDGPGKNALGAAVMEALLDALARAGDEPVLLVGAGDAFSAGLNLKEVVELDRPAMTRFIDTLERLVAALYLHPGPTVACVNGHAIAGGCVLALCCDHRVATIDARARIGLNEVAIGVQYPPALFHMVRQRLPAAAFEEVVLGARLHDPDAAVRLGLVDEVASDPHALATARLGALAVHPRGAYAAAKLAHRAPALALSDADRRRLADEIVPSWAAAETKARLRALLASR